MGKPRLRGDLSRLGSNDQGLPPRQNGLGRELELDPSIDAPSGKIDVRGVLVDQLNKFAGDIAFRWMVVDLVKHHDALSLCNESGTQPKAAEEQRSAKTRPQAEGTA